MFHGYESDGHTYCNLHTGTVPKGLKTDSKELEIDERMETIQTTAVLRIVNILRRFLQTSGDFLSLRLL